MTYRQTLGYITASPDLDLDSEMPGTAPAERRDADVPFHADAPTDHPKPPVTGKPVAGK